MRHSELIETIQANTQYSYSRSAGPGGQNVNKVNTRVTARLPLASLDALGEQTLGRVRRRLSGRMNSEGELLIHVQEERSQARNRQIAEQRLIDLVLAALVEPKRRKPTHPSQGAKRARVDAKKHRGRTKERRRSHGLDED